MGMGGGVWVGCVGIWVCVGGGYVGVGMHMCECMRVGGWFGIRRKWVTTDSYMLYEDLECDYNACMEIQNGATQYEHTSTVFAAAMATLCTPTSWRMGAKETDFQDIYTCTTCEIETATCAQPHSQVKWPGSGTIMTL